MPVTLEVESNTLVIVGNFNPAIFQPYWFFSQDLIGEDEAQKAQISVVHPDITSFQTESFQITVEPERVSLIPLETIGIGIFDLALRLFGDCLPQTPLRALGINYLSHFRVSSEKVQNSFGDILAPKEPWGKWGEQLNQPAPKGSQNRISKETRAGGLRSISMTKYGRDDEKKGFTQVKIEPSATYRPGVYVEVNNHFDLEKPIKGEDNSSIFARLGDVYDSSIEQSKSFVEHFMTTCSIIERDHV
ncbi:hypothetical protein D3273_02085 [Lichenibacterium minor]|uniref:TIGR04255 family protein n=1 Tax=Lichenibacterium minor TaxID=2316528 RepID=A0A4Q2UBS8_9HYPH|nr:hypothetical protein [Lichenibacterium minor]RYC34062.1 hypothetical protein D3273_02085 [Lichenibacterium minor]